MAKSTPRIEILKRGARIKEFALGVQRLVIGSGADANVRLRAPNIQASHFAIEVVERRYLQAVNLAGDPKLLCDGAAFDEQRLSDGSEITLGDIVFRLNLRAAKPAPAAKPEPRRKKDVGVDTAESLPLPEAKPSARFSPPPPSTEDAPTPKELPAVRPVQPSKPLRPAPPPQKRDGVALGEDTELTLEEDPSRGEQDAAEQRELGTETVPMLDGEQAPWERDSALQAAATTDPGAAEAPDPASPEAPQPNPYLMVHPPGVRRKRVRLPAGTFDLGAKGCAISLAFAGVADRHAILTTHEDGTLTIEDAGSGLPTILNGRVIRRAQFRMGDTLQVGRVSFTLEPFVEPVKKPAASRPAASGDATPPSAPAAAQSKFQAEASAKWVEAAMAKRESGEEDDDDSMPGIPVSGAPPAPPGRPRPPEKKAARTAPPAKPTPPAKPAVEPAAEPMAKPAVEPMAKPAARPAAKPAAKAPPPSRRAPPPKKKPAPAPPKKRAAPPPRARREKWAEMPSEYKWQKRKRTALLFLLFLLVAGAAGAYGGWRILEERKARANAAGPSGTETYSWGDGGTGGDGEYTWAGLVASNPDEDGDGDGKRSSRRRGSRRSSRDREPESAIASADGSWRDSDNRGEEEEEEDPEERMLKDLMNESMDIMDEEFEAEQKAWVDMEAVEATLRSVSSTARVCYKRALEDDPELSGTLSLRITIGTSGKVDSISLDPMSTLANAEVQKCVERQVRSKSYPAARGGPVTFTYPFRFDR